jgi:regulator of protease activity HflC (stomatin/prohibitin superfamily)
LIAPRVAKVVKNVFGSYTASRAIQERPKLNNDVMSAFQAELDKYPVLITGFQLEDVKFSPAYEKSVEDRMLAQVEVQKIQQNAEREKVNAQIKVIQANATADAVRAEAKAQADAKTMQGVAEATAIQAKGDALAKNPGLVSLITAEKWSGTLPTTMIPGGAVPFIQSIPFGPASSMKSQ